MPHPAPVSDPSSRPLVLLTGDVMPTVVEAQLAPRCRLLGLTELDAVAAPAVRAIATRGGQKVDAALMARLPALEIVANFGVGYDTVDAAAAARQGVIVTHTPDVLNEEVADLTLGLLLATIRQIPQADAFVRAGRWPAGPFPLTGTLRGRTIGMVGMGRIGRAIAHRLEGFGVPIGYHARHPQPDLAYAYYADLMAMARAVDTLIVIVPGGAATRNLINGEVLAALGADGIVVNVARGSVVDEAALLAALLERRIRGAGLDVFAREPHVPEAFFALDNVVLLPHVGSATGFTRQAMGQLVVDNLLAWFDGRGPLTPVPETPWPRAPAPIA